MKDYSIIKKNVISLYLFFQCIYISSSVLYVNDFPFTCFLCPFFSTKKQIENRQISLKGFMFG